MVDKKKKQSEDIMQHKKDVEKILAELNTMKCNVSGMGGAYTWKGIVKARKEHIKTFLESLDKQEEEFEHFK